MHDLYLAQKLLEIALKKAEENKAVKISEISINLGKETHIKAENLKDNLKTLIQDTIAESASIKIQEIPGKESYIEDIKIEEN